VPTAVTIPSGATSGSFNIATSMVAANTSGHIYATYHEVTLSASITVAPNGLSGVSLAPTTVAGSLTVQGTVTLASPAGPGAFTVALSSNSRAARPTVPSITIPVGSQSGAFTVTTSAVTVATRATLTASANGQSQSAALTVRPISVRTVALSAAKVKAGTTVTGKIALEAPAAPGSITVKIASSNPKVALPSASTITIAKGASTGAFSVLTNKKILVNTTVTIGAAANGGTKTVKLTIIP